MDRVALTECVLQHCWKQSKLLVSTTIIYHHTLRADSQISALCVWLWQPFSTFFLLTYNFAIGLASAPFISIIKLNVSELRVLSGRFFVCAAITAKPANRTIHIYENGGTKIDGTVARNHWSKSGAKESGRGSISTSKWPATNQQSAKTRPSFFCPSGAFAKAWRKPCAFLIVRF